MARKISDFEKIVQEYADQLAKKYNTSVCWICLDGSKEELKEYPDILIDYEIIDPVFNWGDPFAQKDIMFNQTLTNDSSNDSITRISRSEDKTDKFAWSITEGMKIGQTVMTKAGVDLGGISAGFQETTSFEFNLSSTQGGGEETKRSWKIDQEITQSKHTYTDVIWMLDRCKNKAAFSADIIMTGNVAIWFNDRIDLNNSPNDQKDCHWLWFPSVDAVINEVNPKPSGFAAVNGKVLFRAAGTITADVGLKSYLQIKESPIVNTKVLAKSKAIKGKAVKRKTVKSKTTKRVEYIMNSEGKILNWYKSAKE